MIIAFLVRGENKLGVVHLGDHGGLWAKLSAFENSTRVPLILAGAGVPAGRSITAPVELLDVYPTLADYAGFTAPAGLEGRSLRALIEGTDHGDQRVARSLVFHYDVVGKRDVPGRTVISRNWRYTEWAEGSAGFRHAVDPLSMISASMTYANGGGYSNFISQIGYSRAM